MASRKREWAPGAIYHVMGRGIRRTPIYKATEDYKIFLMILQRVKQEAGLEIYSVCLMTNHFHMLIKTGEIPIGKVMNHLMFRYARNFNHKYGYTGHLFDSRYSSGLVRDQRYLLEASRYIHLNPVKAGMVPDAGMYPYSNYNLFAGLPMDEEEVLAKQLQMLTDTEGILSIFRGNRELQYRMFVEAKASHEEQEMRISADIGEEEDWLPW